MPHSDPQDRPNRHHWPPILYVAVIAGAWLWQWLAPLPALLPPLSARLIGWPLFALGFGIGMIALWRFHRVGTSFDPTAPATRLATDGIYRFTRNPMYLGAIAAFLGFGLAWPSTPLMLLTIPLAYALTKLAIEREEAYLERRFGDEYRNYKAQVRRWL